MVGSIRSTVCFGCTNYKRLKNHSSPIFLHPYKLRFVKTIIPYPAGAGKTLPPGEFAPAFGTFPTHPCTAFLLLVLPFRCDSSQRERHGVAVQLLQNADKSPERGAVVVLVGTQDARKAFRAVKGDPCKLAAVVVEKSRRQTDAAAGGDVGQRGVMVGAVEIADLSRGDQPVLDRL